MPEGRGRKWDEWGVWDWWMQAVTFGMDEQWGPTIQHRELCVIGSLCCTTEIEEPLQINYTLIKTNKKKKPTEKEDSKEGGRNIRLLSMEQCEGRIIILFLVNTTARGLWGR